MPMCIHCGTDFNVVPVGGIARPASMKCGKVECGKWTPTGEEDGLRAQMEPFGLGGRYPKVTALRAMGLSNAIYKTANHKTKSTISLTTVEAKLKKENIGGSILWQTAIRGRAHHGFKDESVTAGVVVISNDKGNPFGATIYVVFRGSVGDMNDGLAGYETATNSGDKKSLINVDWRANLDNRMGTPDYVGGNIRMHRGFLDIVASYRSAVAQELNFADRVVRSRGTIPNVVITGHSQGAAHALVFSHWLAYRGNFPNLVCMPFSPPRVGNEHFAADFNRLISNKWSLLPYDGYWSYSAYLMVRGQDPVSHNQKTAFLGPGLSERHAKTDRTGTKALFAKKGFAEKGEAKLRGTELSPAEKMAAGDIYFHPRNLVTVPGIKVTPSEGLNHHPGWFRKRLINDF